MLRPATPLTILLLVAFILLLLSVISTPLVKGIHLATFQGVNFGVFGYCGPASCSGIEVGYSTDGLFNSDTGDFTLPSKTRHSLSSLLIVHPIAALFTLILLILSASAHLHSPSHSPKYLLILLILTFPTILLSLLAFLADILLFQPHMQWGVWLVLTATILLVASGIITCAMRRTLVSRKARKKRIAENAEMSGENYYNRQAQHPAAPPPLSQQPTAPVLDGASGADKLPSFATFDSTRDREDGTVSEDRMPLNQRTPSQNNQGVGMAVMDDEPDRYGAPRRQGTGGPPRGGYGGRDEFGNPLSSSAAFGPVRSHSDPRLRMQYGNGRPLAPSPTSSSNSSPYGSRGRGGYGPYGPRGGYGRGGPPGPFRGPSPSGRGYDEQGIPLGPMVAGAGAGMVAGAMMGRGGRGGRGPPPGYANGYGASPGRGGPYDNDPQYGEGAYPRRQSPGPPSAPGYRGPSPGPPMAGEYRRQSPGPPSAPGYRGQSPGTNGRAYPPNFYAGREPSPGPPQGPPLAVAGALGRRDSPGMATPMPTHPEEHMVGQAVEMDATTGSPSHPPIGSNALRDSDADVRGMVDMQRNNAHPMSGSSVYSGGDAYIPARAKWANINQSGAPPIETAQAQSSPVELPTSAHSNTSPNRPRVNSGDNYYEDVDPRFASEDPIPATALTAELPASLTAGHGGPHPADRALSPAHPHQQGHALEHNRSYEEMDGQRSPTASDISHFTSVSQRGVNPQWQPPPPQPQQQIGMDALHRRPVPPPQQQQQQQQLPQRDVILGGGDFEIPNASRGRGNSIPRTNGAGVGRYPTGNEI